MNGNTDADVRGISEFARENELSARLPNFIQQIVTRSSKTQETTQLLRQSSPSAVLVQVRKEA